MSVRRITTILGVLALGLPVLGSAQGLGDAAAREKAKRQAAKKSGEAKVYTNEDLNEGRAGTPAGETASPAAPSGETPASGYGPPGEPPPESQADQEERDGRAQEQGYLDAVTSARSNVAQLEASIQQLQARLNPMSTTYVYGDFNVGGDKLAEEAQVKADLAQAEADLNAARQALADATQALQDFRQGRLPSDER